LTPADEFHHSVNDQYKKVMSYFKPKYLLGLTATPLDFIGNYEKAANAPFLLSEQSYSREKALRINQLSFITELGESFLTY
jgi:hypothetical protein